MLQWQADTAASSRHIGLEAAAPMDNGAATENSDLRRGPFRADSFGYTGCETDAISSPTNLHQGDGRFQQQAPESPEKISSPNGETGSPFGSCEKETHRFRYGWPPQEQTIFCIFYCLRDMTERNSGTADAQSSEPPSQARTGSNASRIDPNSPGNIERSRSCRQTIR